MTDTTQPATVDSLKAAVRENKQLQRELGYSIRRGNASARERLYATRCALTELEEQLKAAKFAARSAEEIHIDELIEARKRLTKEEQTLTSGRNSRIRSLRKLPAAKRGAKKAEAAELDVCIKILWARRGELEKQLKAARKAAKLAKALGEGALTCPCCLSARQLVGKTISRHGWTVQGDRHPGEWGGSWHTGACMGYGQLPLEQSPKGAFLMLDALAKRQDSIRTQLARLVDERPELTTIVNTDLGEGWKSKTLATELQAARVRETSSGPGRYRNSIDHMLAISDGYVGRADSSLRIPSYELLQSAAVSGCEQELRSLHRYREALRAAVAEHGWSAELAEYDRS
jgi:hypothetical protein